MIKSYYSRLASVVLDWDDWMGQQHYSTQFPPSPPPSQKKQKKQKNCIRIFFSWSSDPLSARLLGSV